MRYGLVLGRSSRWENADRHTTTACRKKMFPTPGSPVSPAVTGLELEARGQTENHCRSVARGIGLPNEVDKGPAIGWPFHGTDRSSPRSGPSN